MGPFKDGWTKEQVESVIRNDDPDEVLYVPVVVSLDPPDYEWSESICIQLADHTHFNIRGNAILGFGHLARIFGVASAQARRLVGNALQDENQYVRDHADGARGDIEHFTQTKLTEGGGGNSASLRASP